MRTPSQPPRAQAAPLNGIGYYRGDPLPSDPVGALIRGLLGALKGPPGIRLSTTAPPNARYFGTDLVAPFYTQQTVSPAVNTPDDLAPSLIQSDTYGPGVPL